ncbi:MAG: hypothetical protein KIT27_10790 [Legionellales bacterium]|nr:hypothetical protein [Legionellales bacterium]
MQLNLDQNSQILSIARYTDRSVTLGEHTYTHSILISAQHLQAWQIHSPLELNPQHLSDILALKPSILLIGAQRNNFPPLAFRKACLEAKIGLEIMEFGAACRTYNVLIAEKRPVVAGLCLNPSTIL